MIPRIQFPWFQWGDSEVTIIHPRYLIASIFPRPVPIICVWKWAISWYIPQHLGKMMINHWIYTIFRQTHLGMDQYLVIPFLGGWTSIYQLFWCLPGVQGFDTLPFGNLGMVSLFPMDPVQKARAPWILWTARLHVSPAYVGRCSEQKLKKMFGNNMCMCIKGCLWKLFMCLLNYYVLQYIYII